MWGAGYQFDNLLRAKLVKKIINLVSLSICFDLNYLQRHPIMCRVQEEMT